MFDELTQEQQRLCAEATDKITIDMMFNLEHGDELDLNDEFVLYHYTEEDVFVVNLKSEWTEILQVLIDGDEIVLETL